MATRGGMFVDPVPGTPPVGMGAIDGRLALAGMVGSSFGLLSGGGVTVSSSAMSFALPATVWRIPDPNTSGAVFVSPTDATTLTTTSTGATIPAGPSTGSRIDIIVVRQNNYAAGDANSQCVLSYVAGVASGSPSAPAVPAGAQLYATVNVPANASNSAACTVTVATAAVLAGQELAATSLASLQLTVGTVGQDAVVTGDPTAANNGKYRYGGSSYGWVPYVTVATAATSGGAPPASTVTGVTLSVALTAVPWARKVTIAGRALVTTNGGTYCDIQIWKNGASVAAARAQAVGSVSPVYEEIVPSGATPSYQLIASASPGGTATIPNDSSLVSMTVGTVLA